MRQALWCLLPAALIFLTVPALAGASDLPTGGVLTVPLGAPAMSAFLGMRDKSTSDRAFIAEPHMQLRAASCAVATPAVTETIGSLFEPSAALTSCCTPTLVLICQREGLRCGFDDLGNCGCQLNGPR